MEVVYEGERLFWGNLGHFSVVLSFCAAIFCTFAFWFSAKNPLDTFWKKLSRIGFHVHSVAVLGIIFALFYIIHGHYFEYHYAWQHSSTDLPVKYMISCFWEGQEGSFLLWIFWQMVIGQILLLTAKGWTPQVMTVMSLSQIALCSMLLGVKILDYKVGSSPFELLRNAMGDAPIFQRADYLKFFKEGNGLNPLLQNYWMVIHPPTLFFGFATTIVPFAYAVSALWTKKYTEWIKPALPWALISVMVLGTGIIMGAFWAYESLSFGGYWAWDPVENASLIPWLILIGGMHTMLIFKSSGNSLRTTFILILSTFLLVLYATFLTRSGILGNASVHSFTDLGMSGQLLVFMFMFVILAVVLLIKRWDSLPVSEKDQNAWSREFWMFIGALVLVISAFQVIVTTSIPVYNKIMEAVQSGLAALIPSIKDITASNLASPVDPIEHYNKWQMPIAIIIALLTGIGQYFKYKKTDSKVFLKRTGIVAAIALILAAVGYKGFDLSNYIYFVFLFAAIFTILANIQVMTPLLGGNSKVPGASVAHIGFGLLLIGVLISSANKKIITYNNTGKMLFAAENEKQMKENYENIYLEKGKPVKMNDYIVTYVSDSMNWVNTYYRINYKQLHPETNETVNEFDLFPNAQINPKMGLIANPDTRHYFTHDVFTFVSSVPDKKAQQENNEFSNTKEHTINIGDTIKTENASIILKGIDYNIDKTMLNSENLNLLIGANMQVISDDKTYEAIPLMGIKDSTLINFEDHVEEAGIKLRFLKLIPDKGPVKLVIETSEKSPQKDYVIMKAIVFPFINFVWSGTIIMVIGFLMAISRRVKEYRRLKD